MSCGECQPEIYDLFGTVKDYQYKLLRNEIEEDDFLCMVARLPGSTPALAQKRRDQVRRVLINSLPNVGRKHPMTMHEMKRIELSRKLFGTE